MPTGFGPYLILETFARGGMGEVHLAKVRRGDADVTCVVKTLRPERAGDRESVSRFVDEARVAVTLDHPNVCRVFDVGRVGEQHYLAMEYVAGRDLRDLLDRTRSLEQPLPIAAAIEIASQALIALEYAHQRTHPRTGEPLLIVHRDVSPHNVLLGFDGVVRLIDFGLAASRLKIEKTEPDVVHGKMAYMSPEQARGQEVDARADIFALGVVLYEMLAGQRFYQERGAAEVWRLAGDGGFRPACLGQLDKSLAEVIVLALQPAGTRFSSCAQMRAALRTASARFPPADLRGLMEGVFACEVSRERERVTQDVSTTSDLEAATISQRVSLLEASVEVPAADVYQGPKGRGVGRLAAPGVVHVVLRGHGDEAAGAWQRSLVDRQLERGAKHVYFFSDVEQLATHDAIFREQMTQWQARVKGRVTQLVLFRSRLVVVAISVANALSGGGTEVTSSRTRFEVALAEAVARAKVAAH